ncbi:competence protein ComEA [Photobacterium jeanii]|uniref:Competence protein ComEA n=1 Tax=Photobacterium jeanii TaxID=858640 RepID=A0A178K7D5_9GAMM|nr:helix-hairpin-helix domain-containing protein [Photobacterium jeanii]OAN12986.1 competence protein ComEA [Photobacterium jeanii]PST89133.1 competence protein ComEA [Photobacterium jeanii]
MKNLGWASVILLAISLFSFSAQAATADKGLKAEIKQCETKYKSDKNKKTDCIKKAEKAAKKKAQTASSKSSKDKATAKADKSKPEKAASSKSATKKALKPVNVNTASAAQLAESLPGVGEKKAKAIVDYRKKHGKFKSAKDLESVPGLGEKSVSGMKKYLKF